MKVKEINRNILKGHLERENRNKKDPLCCLQNLIFHDACRIYKLYVKVGVLEEKQVIEMCY